MLELFRERGREREEDKWTFWFGPFDPHVHRFSNPFACLVMHGPWAARGVNKLIKPNRSSHGLFTVSPHVIGETPCVRTNCSSCSIDADIYIIVLIAWASISTRPRPVGLHVLAWRSVFTTDENVQPNVKFGSSESCDHAGERSFLNG